MVYVSPISTSKGAIKVYLRTPGRHLRAPKDGLVRSQGLKILLLRDPGLKTHKYLSDFT